MTSLQIALKLGNARYKTAKVIFDYYYLSLYLPLGTESTGTMISQHTSLLQTASELRNELEKCLAKINGKQMNDITFID